MTYIRRVIGFSVFRPSSPVREREGVPLGNPWAHLCPDPIEISVKPGERGLDRAIPGFRRPRRRVSSDGADAEGPPQEKEGTMNGAGGGKTPP